MNVLFDFDSVRRMAKIVSPVLPEIREIMSVEDKAQFFMKKRLGRNIPTRKYAVTPQGFFDIPLFDELCRQIKSAFPSAQIDATETFMERLKTPKIAHSITPLPLKFDPYDYQQESVEEALAVGRGVIVLPTSAGKTVVAALLSNTCVTSSDRNVLILVPNTHLVAQTFKDFIEYGVDESLFSMWSGDNDYQSTRIVIANNQILLSKSQDTSVLKRFGLVIADECLRGNTLVDTEHGAIPIQHVKVGDSVKSYNASSKQTEYQSVLNTWKNLPLSNSYDHFLEIATDDGHTLQVTPNHKIHTTKGLMRADELTEGDDIIGVRSSKLVCFWYKYLYVKKKLQTYMSDLWRNHLHYYITPKTSALPDPPGLL